MEDVITTQRDLLVLAEDGGQTAAAIDWVGIREWAPQQRHGVCPSSDGDEVQRHPPREIPNFPPVYRAQVEEGHVAHIEFHRLASQLAVHVPYGAATPKDPHPEESQLVRRICVLESHVAVPSLIRVANHDDPQHDHAPFLCNRQPPTTIKSFVT